MLNDAERVEWIKKNEAWVGPEIGENLFPVGWVCCTPLIPWVRGKTWEEAIDNCDRALRAPITPVTPDGNAGQTSLRRVQLVPRRWAGPRFVWTGEVCVGGRDRRIIRGTHRRGDPPDASGGRCPKRKEL